MLLEQQVAHGDIEVAAGVGDPGRIAGTDPRIGVLQQVIDVIGSQGSVPAGEAQRRTSPSQGKMCVAIHRLRL